MVGLKLMVAFPMVCVVSDQIRRVYEKRGLVLQSCGANTEPVRRCLVAGFFLNAARSLFSSLLQLVC